MKFLQFARDYGKFLLKDKRGFWPAVIGAVGALGSSLINYEAQQGANDKSIELWREQAQWNKPINQMARYQEAGLNPNLVYSQGNPGNLASSPTPKAPQVDLDLLGAMQLDASLKNMREQNKNLQAQNSLIESQTSVAKENARKQALENDYFERHGQYPSTEGGIVGTAKSLFNYLPDLYNFIMREIPGSLENRKYNALKERRG